jgi:hypothetical protein
VTATWARLRSGEWGLRVEGPTPRPGDSLEVRAKDGRTARATVGRVVWSDGQVSLATVERAPRRRPRCACACHQGSTPACSDCRGFGCPVMAEARAALALGPGYEYM